ncbi:hypothetical protein [Robertkochia sediminum]|uniref:hypothetical protein n=1 Tax=Robertkochia sediminum TaxID=2785326 RepID=UPI001933BAE2|nr:hypothetical protein [Robertkochia sediminum]MBL7472235.1 hypothetical protein [Robertkochia sediminum]
MHRNAIYHLLSPLPTGRKVILRLAGPVKGWNASLVRVGIYLPFMAMAFDYSENLLIARMITDPDHASTGLIKAASVFTLLKGISTSASWWFIAMLGGSRLKSHFSKKPVKAV